MNLCQIWTCNLLVLTMPPRNNTSNCAWTFTDHGFFQKGSVRLITNRPSIPNRAIPSSTKRRAFPPAQLVWACIRNYKLRSVLQVQGIPQIRLRDMLRWKFPKCCASTINTTVLLWWAVLLCVCVWMHDFFFGLSLESYLHTHMSCMKSTLLPPVKTHTDPLYSLFFLPIFIN